MATYIHWPKYHQALVAPSHVRSEQGLVVSDHDEALERLLSLEQSEGLWNRRLLGQEIWPMLRLSRYLQETNDGVFRPPPTSEAAPQRTLQNIRNMLVSAQHLLGAGPIAQPKRDIWVLSWSKYRRGVDNRGGRQCVFAEGLREQLGSRLLFLEINNGNLPHQKREDLGFVDLPQRMSLWTARAGGELLAHLPGMTKPWGDEFSSSLLYERALYTGLMRAQARRWIEKARPLAVFVIYGSGNQFSR